MKFRAHDTFFIRKGWLSKGMKAVHSKPDVFVAKDENPMDVLGIGSNMVKSLRYWLVATNLTEEALLNKRRVQKFTGFGNQIFKNDRYMEEYGTLYLLHYMLSKNEEDATAWYFFFNEFNMSEFTREDFVAALQNYVSMKGETVAIRSMSDDFACILNTYLPRYKTNPARVNPENNIDCPLGELGLIDILDKNKKTYRKAAPSPETIHPWVLMAVMCDQANGRMEIGLNELLTAKCNIGNTFNLDAITMLDALHQVEKIGLVKIIRTAGLDVIQLKQNYSFEECVDNYYECISKID